MAWDEAKKEKVIKMYKESEPTPDNSIEIVKEIADEVGETPNGVRMILSKAGVYVKATQTTASTSKKGATDEPKAPKVSKTDKIASLSEAISSAGMVPNAEILDKLTGKAADYFTQVIKALITALESKDE